MERDDFKKIIKLRCGLKDKKASNSIKTPYDGYLKEYITKLVKSQMEIDSLGIMLNGNLCWHMAVVGMLKNSVPTTIHLYLAIITTKPVQPKK